MKKSLFIIPTCALLISCWSDHDIGLGYKIQYDGAHIAVVTDTTNTVLIKGQVYYYNYNEDLILICQKPLDSICECNYDCFVKMDSYDRQSYKRCKEALKESAYQLFWIIDKTRSLERDTTGRTYSNIYGPMTREKFLEKLNIITPQGKLSNEFQKNFERHARQVINKSNPKGVQ